ncbi:MAG: phosphate ABC transporter permease PstA [Opitutaceae bacterium]|nr:phosphate ABC transporter permease PstA [Opitutaceae bacterium]
MPAIPPPAASPVRRLFRRGDHLLWLSGGALGLAILLITGLLLLVFLSGFTFFWPYAVTTADRSDGTKLMGVISNRQAERRDVEGNIVKPALTQFKVGNRELYGFDFIWVPNAQLNNLRQEPEVIALERQEYGDFYGFLEHIEQRERVIGTGAEAWALLHRYRPGMRELAVRARHIQRDDIGVVNHEIQKATLQLRRLERTVTDPERRARAVATIQARLAALNRGYDRLRAEAETISARSLEYAAVFRTVDGQEKRIPLAAIVRAYQPNRMSGGEKLWHYLGRAAEFVYGEPRESNTEGGVWPAIFGTVLMTLIMSIVVTPVGVVAAFYLREYAKQGLVVRMVRIAINNLAGVPSIVFGVFGLGFFVYFIGGGIDRLFFPELLPTPTFGTGGILWASLTLALLTVPVVIVATEESIAAVPRGVREGSLALGASKFQTICNVVLPASVPGILTGVILAMARGAGEVAPLMITGVVKLAPELPLDGRFPFFHLDRKFMHLGFHIYDVGFQSPNIEAAKPMVFTTALLLIAIVVIMNLFAIRLRDRIRKKYQTGAF